MAEPMRVLHLVNQLLDAALTTTRRRGFPERVVSEPEVIARHCEQAGLVAPAITHYQRAGERAQRSANEEAVGHLRRALGLVAMLPETRERHWCELGLQMAIGAPLSAARGWSHPEFEGTYSRARAGVPDRRVACLIDSLRHVEEGPRQSDWPSRRFVLHRRTCVESASVLCNRMPLAS